MEVAVVARVDIFLYVKSIQLYISFACTEF